MTELSEETFLRAQVRKCQPEDVPSWCELARSVQHLFGPMPDIRSVIERGIERDTAFVTGPPGSVTGGMLVGRSGPPYRITWLAVAPHSRGQGLGAALVHAATRQWPTGDIEVVTFAVGTLGGEPARRLYARLGFVCSGPAAPAPDGGLRELFVLRR